MIYLEVIHVCCSGGDDSTEISSYCDYLTDCPVYCNSYPTTCSKYTILSDHMNCIFNIDNVKFKISSSN